MERNNYTKKLIDLVKDKKLAEKIEKSIYEWTEEYTESNSTPEFMFENFYQDKFSDILKNLDEKYNSYLLKAIKNKEIDPEKLAFLKPEEVFPEKFDSIIKKKKIEQAIKENKASTNAFKCPKCKSRKSKIHQRQMRACDEPVTTFVTCLECGNVTKF